MIGSFFKPNTKSFTEFTNCNLSEKLVELTLLFFNDVEEHELPSNCPKPYLRPGENLSLQSLEFYSCIQFETRNDWPVDVTKL